MASPLTIKSPTTSAAISNGRLARRPKSIDMPTATKNSPMSRPLNGSTSVSSAWRYSEPASRTPARNAPSAMDTPAAAMSCAMPTTSSSVNPVNTSRRPVRATMRKSGRVR